MPLVFVYGSLKRDKRLNFYLKDAKFLGEAITCKKYSMIVSKKGWYPYLFDEKGSKNIKGEVYKVSFSLLKVLDRVEEAPNYYYRKKICVKLKDKKIFAWVYFKRKRVKFNKREVIDEF